MTFTWEQLLQAYTVEVIRRLWDAGHYRRNKWLKVIHREWFNIWVDWKTDLTMRDVDKQIEEMFYEWEDDDWMDDLIHTETIEGETPLGGEMRLRSPYKPQEGP